MEKGIPLLNQFEQVFRYPGHRAEKTQDCRIRGFVLLAWMSQTLSLACSQGEFLVDQDRNQPRQR